MGRSAAPLGEWRTPDTLRKPKPRPGEERDAHQEADDRAGVIEQYPGHDVAVVLG